MKVYIGWSGQTSKEVASILKVWLPQMNAHIEMFVSMDIPKDAIWRDELFQVIAACDCAIFCCTQDNIRSPWLCFEAGRISAAEKPLYLMLFDAPPMQSDSPLQMFRHFELEERSLRQMAYELNRLCGEWQVPPDAFDRIFDGLYPTVKKMLAQVRDSQRERLQESQSEQSEEDLKRDFATLNGKLDVIISRLSRAPFGAS